jgi:Protein of unknown function (DUF3800)
MYVTYFDEVKADPRQGQNSYWVGGITVPMEAIEETEGRVNELAKQVFGSTELTPDTEFHCKLLYAGRGPFKGRKPEERIDIFVSLVDILVESEVIKRVFAEIVTARLMGSQKKPNEIAFAFFCERVQMLVSPQTTILIGDQDDEQVKAMIRDFSRYRADGTFWDYGIKIKNVVDTVHFARSHHSRMIQLADVYMFYVTHMYSKSRQGWMAEKLREKLKGKDLYPHRYKKWPPRAGRREW